MESVTSEQTAPGVAPSGDASADAEPLSPDTSGLSPSSALSLRMITKLKAKTRKWRNLAPIENFGRMSYRDFKKMKKKEQQTGLRDMLRQSSLAGSKSDFGTMRHESWGTDDEPQSVLPFNLIWLFVSLAVSMGLGFGVGFGCEDAGWGAGSAILMLFFCYSIYLTIVIVYCSQYSDGLHKADMPGWIESLGFEWNSKFLTIMRYHYTCCHTGACDLMGVINDKLEATTALERIMKLNDGNGPEKGATCWIGDSEFTFWHHMRDDCAAFDYNGKSFNAGFGGARIVDVENNLDTLCLNWDPSTVIVHCGGNDWDCDNSLPVDEIPNRLLHLFGMILEHPSVKRVGYMLSSRRPCYSDVKWEFMIRVHTMAVEMLDKSALRDRVVVFDLRDMIHPISQFWCDHQHLNKEGHALKAKELMPKITAVWSNSSRETSFAEARAIAPLRFSCHADPEAGNENRAFDPDETFEVNVSAISPRDQV